MLWERFFGNFIPKGMKRLRCGTAPNKDGLPMQDRKRPLPETFPKHRPTIDQPA